MSLAWLPALLATTMITSVLVSYGIAVGLGHIPAFLPYISDAGVLAPERSFFGFSLCVSAVLMLALQVIRFEEVRQSCKKYRQDCTLRILNRSSLLLGTLSAAGLVLIGNFQAANKDVKQSNFSSSAVDIVEGAEVIHKFHWSGAFFTFVIGSVWMFVQSFITLRVAHSAPVASCCRLLHSKYLTTAARFSLSIADAFFLVSGVGIVIVDESIGPVAAATSPQWDSSAVDDPSHSNTAAAASSPVHRTTSALGVMAAACEWIVVAIIIAFVASFVVEFSRIRLRRGATVAFNVDAVDAVEDVANVNENNGTVAVEGAAIPLMPESPRSPQEHLPLRA